jgi:hypothetical protein
VKFTASTIASSGPQNESLASTRGFIGMRVHWTLALARRLAPLAHLKVTLLCTGK